MQTLSIRKDSKYTVGDYLNEEELCQLIDGNLIMSPAPNTIHQRIVGKLYIILNRFAEGYGEVFLSPFDVYLNEHNVLQSDLLFVSNERSNIISERGVEGAPDLVLEVLSPSNSFIDRNRKKDKYFEFGVKEYWIVNPDNQSVKI